MPLDPTASIARRAWFDCPNCAHGVGCEPCESRRNCDDHWQYLLSNTGTLLHLQCPSCAHLWDRETRVCNSPAES